MNKIYSEGINLITQESYIEAYEFFDNLVKENDKDIIAKYYRASVDFFYLKKNKIQTYKDFECVINKKKFLSKKLIYPLICALAEDFEEYENVIKYGLMAIKYKSINHEMCYSALGRSYYMLGCQKNDSYYFQQSLEMFLKVKELFPDDEIDTTKSLVDVYYKLNDYDACLNQTEKLMGSGLNDGILYYYRGMCKYHCAQSKEDYADVVDCFDKALNYNGNDEECRFYRAISYYYLDEVEKSDEELLSLYKEINNPSFTHDLFHFYASVEEYDKIINFYDLDTILKDVPLKFFYARVLDFYGDESQKEVGLKYFKELFEEVKNADIFDFIRGRYLINNNPESLLEYINSILDKSDSEFPIVSLLCAKIQAYRLMKKPYDEIYTILNELTHLGDCRYEFIYNELYVNPNPDRVFLKYAMSPKYSKGLDERLKAAIYLYGDGPFKSNSKKVKKYIPTLLRNIYHSCSLTLVGRYEEIVNRDYEKAYKIYKDAYEMIYDYHNDYCNCASAFYAHALYNNFNNESDLIKTQKEAYDIIKREIEKKKYCNSSNVHYLYAYFALKNVEGFSIHEAIKMLEISMTECVYDLDNIYLLYKAYNLIDEKKRDYYKNLFNEAMNKSSQLQCKYYQSKLNDELIYPFLNNK